LIKKINISNSYFQLIESFMDLQEDFEELLVKDLEKVIKANVESSKHRKILLSRLSKKIKE